MGAKIATDRGPRDHTVRTLKEWRTSLKAEQDPCGKSCGELVGPSRNRVGLMDQGGQLLTAPGENRRCRGETSHPEDHRRSEFSVGAFAVDITFPGAAQETNKGGRQHVRHSYR